MSEHFNKFIDQISRELKAQAKILIVKHTDELYDAVKENISKNYHSPSEYRRLGFPFALKDGEIKPHGHLPLWSVHMKNGTVIKGFNKWIEITKNQIVGSVGWKSPNKIVIYILHGTMVMLDRDVLRLTAIDINLHEKIKSDLTNLKIQSVMK